MVSREGDASISILMRLFEGHDIDETLEKRDFKREHEAHEVKVNVAVTVLFFIKTV